MRKLKEIASFSKGQQINGSKLLHDGKYDFLNGGIKPSGKWSDYNAEGNTVAISEGGNSCGYVNYMQNPFWCGAHCYYLYNLKVPSKYLYYALKSQQDFLMKLRTGSCMPNISTKALAEFEFPIDFCPEVQKKVVSVLDKVSALIDLRKRELDVMDTLIKARFVEMFGDPELNNKGFPVYPLCELCEIGSSKRIYQNEQSESGVPFLRISDLTNRVEKNAQTVSLYISERRYEELREQGLTPKPGDILVTSRGTLGMCYLYKEEDRFYFQDGMISWLRNFKSSVDSRYLFYLFQIPGFRKQISELQAKSTVSYISIVMLKKLKVILPDLKLQKHFFAFIDSVNHTRAAVRCGLERLETLKASLMQEYFRVR